MSCGSTNPDEAGGSVSHEDDPQGMESETSTSTGSEESGSSSGSGSESSAGSPRSPLYSPATPPPESRRAQLKYMPTNLTTRRKLVSKETQTENTVTEDYKDVRQAANEPLVCEPACTSEGTLRLMIQNFKSMSDTVRGPSKEILGVNWRIMVMPRQHVVQKKGTQKCLGFFLQCCPEAYSESWSCQAQAELRLISQKSGVPHFTRKTNHNYTAKENDWGYSCFMTWADILDENQGYISNDRVILEVTVKAEPPKNILSHADFKTQIEKWRDLAEMHFNRNNIDLAIEANQQALKFCKDRDPELKLVLEEQKNYFIEQKVQESIQRIEKAEPTKSEDQGTSQTALKQALTQSMARNQPKKAKTPKRAEKPKRRETSEETPPTSPPSTELRVEEKPITETAATIKNIPHAREVDGKMVIEGNFPPNLAELLPNHHYMNPEELKNSISWVRRNRAAEEFYNELAMNVQEDFEKMKIHVDENCAEFEESALYNEEGQRAIFEQLIEQNFFEMMERKSFRKHCEEQATKDAKAFTEEVLARLAGTPDETEAIDEQIAQLGANLNFLDDEKSKEWRIGLLDRMLQEWHDSMENQAVHGKLAFLENIPQASWLMGGNQEFMSFLQPTDDYSDVGSTMSSDSERQTDGCMKAKRSKIEKIIVPIEPPRMVDMCCQTEQVPKMVEDATHDAAVRKTPTPLPSNPKMRAQAPKPQQKKKKNEPTMQEKVDAKIVSNPPAAGQNQVATATAASATNTNTNAQLSTDENMINFGTFKVVAAPLNDGEIYQSAVAPRILPMEYAMKFFPNSVPDLEEIMRTDDKMDANKLMEDWVRSWLQEAQKMKPTNTNGVITNPNEFVSAYSDQVISALSAVALNFMNVRRLTNKVNEVLNNLQERSRSIKMDKHHQQIFNMAGLTYDIPSEPIFQKTVPNTDHTDGDYVLIEQINYLEAIKDKLNKQGECEKEASKRVGEALKKIDEKLRSNDKVIEDLKKKVDEAEKGSKKLEKSTRQDINNLRNQLNNEKDRTSNLQKEIKEKNKEIKRLETRNVTIGVERDDFADKAKNIQKEMTTLQKKHNEEMNKLRREMSNLNESRKNLQNGIGERDNEKKCLQHQVEEKNNQLKRIKIDIEQERQKCTAYKNEVEKVMERAKKSEIDLLNRELEVGMALLERAHLDATKHSNEMEEAVGRARSSAEVNTLVINKNEWAAIIEQIETYMKQTKVEFAAHIEAIKEGKTLASLPKITVPKPPPPPNIIKIPVVPVVPVEPTKNAPGPIGPPSRANPTSPHSRAPGSPIPKPGQISPSSPVRHPGAIGTRPNGAPITGSSSNSERNSLFSESGHSLLNNWVWEGPLDSLLGGHASSTNSDLLSLAPGPRVDQNGWDEQNNTWSNNHTSSVNQYISGPLGGHSSRSNSNTMFGHPPGWPRPQSAQHQPISVEQQQRQMQHQMFYNFWQPIVDNVAKKLHVEPDRAFHLVRSYMQENNINPAVSNMTADQLAEAIYQKRYAESTSRLPPGAAPGYLQNPLMGPSFLDRNAVVGTSLNTFSQDHNLLSNLLSDNCRPSSSTDKWSI